MTESTFAQQAIFPSTEALLSALGQYAGKFDDDFFYQQAWGNSQAWGVMVAEGIATVWERVSVERYNYWTFGGVTG